MQLDHRYNEFKLRAIMSEHKKTITAISWCPHNPEVFASASADNLLIIWNVAEQKIVARLDNTKGTDNELCPVEADVQGSGWARGVCSVGRKRFQIE